MNKTKEQQAQEYAKSFVNKDNYHTAYGSFLKGYTACEQYLWRSVEEEEPPIGKLILCCDSLDVALVYYNGEGMFEAENDGELNMRYWMPIPSLPETNTEKR